jgi:uncharacterized protein YqjF (DUF2071 family)
MGSGDRVSGPQPEESVRCALIGQRWRDVSFLHWRYEPGVIQTLLPDGLTVDTHGGAAWVGLTPLAIEASRPLLLPPVPGMASFPETNLRTYVLGPDGTDGLWFFTLEADSVSTVIVASSLLGVPYRWATMTVHRQHDRITYQGRRRLRRSTVAHHVVVRPRSKPVSDPEGLAGWVTGRWRAWTRIAGRLAVIPAEHEPWPLMGAELLELDEDLTADAGLPPPAEPPVVHFAAGVNVRLGWPRRPDGKAAGSAD